MSSSARVRDFIRSNIVGFIAVYLALGGISWAALNSNSVKSKHIKDGQVMTNDLADGAVTELKLADGSVVTAKIADNAVTGAKVDESTLGKVPSAGQADTATQAETAAQAANADTLDSLDSGDLQKRVTGECPADSAIRQIAENGTVTCEEDTAGGGGPSGSAGGDLAGEYPNPTIAAGAVSGGNGGKLADGSVTHDDLANNAVFGGNGGDLADNSVTGADIASNTIGSGDVDSAQIQRRVTGGCFSNQAMIGVNENGSVSCATPQASGPAGGDLTGNFPSPSIANGAVSGGNGGKLADNSVTGDDVLESSLAIVPNSDLLDGLSSSAFLQTSTAFGGDVTGTAANLQVGNNAIGSGEIQNGAVAAADIDPTQVQARISGTCPAGTAASGVTQGGLLTCVGTSASGPAGGDLTGFYPSPTIAANAVGTQEVDGSLTGSDIMQNTITGLNIDESTLDPTKIPSALVSDFKSGFATGNSGNDPIPNATSFIGPPAVVSVSGPLDEVFVSGTAALGADGAAATGLTLDTCVRLQGSGNPPSFVGGMLLALTSAANSRQPYTVSGIRSNLGEGTYEVGLCGSATNANWTNNDYAFNSAVVLR